MTITQPPATAVAVPGLAAAWTLYADIFTGVNELAAQRHLMTFDEFADVYRNPNLLKFFTYTDGEPVGISVLTNHLDQWPLISPRYFARQWPDHYARKAIWYAGFVGVAAHQPHGFRDLVAQMYTHIIGNNGLAVMDVCTHNMIQRRLPDATLTTLSRLNPAATTHVIDAQYTVLYRFDQAT